MTPRSLFSIILKALGIFFIRDIVTIIPEAASALITIINFGIDNGSGWQLGYIIIQLAIFIYISYFLIFNTQRLIDLFKLDAGFEEDQFSISVPTVVIFQIAIIVTGAYLVVNEVPNLFRLIYFSLEGQGYSNTEKPGMAPIVASIVRIIIGLLLVGERNRIALLLNSKEKIIKEDEVE